jgi:hypothetical protein
MIDLSRDFTILTVHGTGQKNWTVRAIDHAEFNTFGVSFRHSETRQVVLIPWGEIGCVRQALAT